MTTVSSNAFICLLAMPRTGSSYLADLLSRHPDIEVHTELFHRAACFLGVAHRDRLTPLLAREVGRPLADFRDPALVAWVHQHPERFLELLAQQRTAPHLFLKIFPRHLDLVDLDRAILHAPPITSLLLKRHPLTTFVSQLKAMETNSWSHRDTTGLQVQTDAIRFLEYVERREAWYSHIRSALQKQQRPVIEIQYETLTACGSEQAALDLLVDAIDQAGCTLNRIELPPDQQGIRQKQDRSTNPLSAIHDVARFIRDLQSRQALHHLEPFLEAPR